MAFTLEIPKELAHLKIAPNGYPIPYFVSYHNGKPEFRFIDRARMKMIYERKVCHICGKKLPKDYFYFISGPLGLKNCVTSDAAMHRLCAEFSMKACPHLYLEKAERRENDPRAQEINAKAPGYVVKEKPKKLYIVKCSSFKVDYTRFLLFFTPLSTEEYQYIDGLLTKL